MKLWQECGFCEGTGEMPRTDINNIDCPECNGTCMVEDKLTYVDHVAVEVLTALTPNIFKYHNGKSFFADREPLVKHLAQEAYAIADAMAAERERRRGEE